jgi:hypothetical protein
MMLMRGWRRRVGRPGGKAARGGGGAPEAGEENADEEDGEEADARRSLRGRAKDLDVA